MSENSNADVSPCVSSCVKPCNPHDISVRKILCLNHIVCWGHSDLCLCLYGCCIPEQAKKPVKKKKHTAIGLSGPYMALPHYVRFRAQPFLNIQCCSDTSHNRADTFKVA